MEERGNEGMTVGETIQTRNNRKRKEPEGSCSEPLDDGEDESNVPKKKRFTWTTKMHQKFLDAIAQLGEDRAFPKKIVEVMDEPGLTRENVASHLQKYRLHLRKSQEERDYLGTSQLASNNYFPVSTSIRSSLYGIRTGIGATSVRLAPPSYSAFDVSSLSAQYSQRTEANKSFQDYGHEERNMLNTFIKTPCSSTSDSHATSSSSTNCAFMGLRIADDGKSLSFGGLDSVVSTRNYSTKALPSIFAKPSPLPPFPDSEDHMVEPSLPPFPEFNVENSMPGVETEKNESINLIPQQDTYNGTSGNVDINSLFSEDIGTSSDYQNSLRSLALKILENIEAQNTQISSNHTVTSLPLTNSSWNQNMNIASNLLINEEVSLPPLPSEVPWDLYPDTTTSSSVPPLPSGSEWNVNPDASIMPVSNNTIPDPVNLLPSLPSEISWNLDRDPVSTYTGNFFDEQNTLSYQIIDVDFRNPSLFNDNMQ